MRFAIFSDIHANLQAWETVLEDIGTQDVDTLICLGDVIGYGPMPGPVLESVYQNTDNFVLGNHDAVVGGRIDASTFNPHARHVIEWTVEQLGEEGAAFFAQVPLTLRGEKMLFTHGDAARPGHFDYVVKAEDARPSFQACKDEVIFFGHTHEPGVFACASNKGIIDKLPSSSELVLKKGRRYMINPGSVGDPRSASDLRASYCLYDDKSRRVTFRRLEFDVDAYRADLEASGLEMQPFFLRAIDAGSRRPEEEEELAIAHDHHEEVEVDDSLLVQPRALVTLGNPMANRPKLHFDFAHPHGHAHPGAPPAPPPIPHQQHAQVPPLPPSLPPGYPHPHAHPHAGGHPPQVPAPMPVPEKRERHGMAVFVTGVLIGVAALVWVISHFSGPSRASLADVSGRDGEAEEESVTEDSGLLSEEGWEPAQTPHRSRRSAVAPGPVFSLSSLVENPYEKYAADVPEGVGLIDRDGGGQRLSFGESSSHVEIPELEAANIRKSITVAAWIKISPADHDRLIFARGSAKPLPIYLMVTSSEHEKPGCVIFGGQGLSRGPVRSSSANRVDDGQWHLVAGSYDEERAKLRVYIDGKLSKEIDGCRGRFPKVSGPLRLGGGVEGFGKFDGEIYGARIFAWGLRSADVRKVFENGE